MNRDTSLMNKLFEKLDDLKTIFQYSEKLIPVIQKLIDFMRETIPLLEDINDSITETTNKIPTAANQISDVTNATEMATTEILDTVDKIILELNFSRENITNILNNSEQNLNKYLKEKLNAVLISLNQINEYANNVTISLQVQDITAQQLSAVNHLITSVQIRLTKLFNELEGTEITNQYHSNNNNNFNENARYRDVSQQQKEIDNLINSNLSSSQTDIDKFFKKK